MVVSDLLLTATATASSTTVSTELARALEAWEGPGLLVIAGNLFDLSGHRHADGGGRAQHGRPPPLREAFRRFLDSPERRVIRQTGTHEPGYDTHQETVAAMAAMGVEQYPVVDLHLHTTTGLRRVRVEPGEHAYAAGRTARDRVSSRRPTPSRGDGELPGRGPLAPPGRAVPGDAPWLEGLDRLSDPSALSRFVTSRVLYRRFGRYAWWLLVPFAVAALLRVAVTPWVLDTSERAPGRAIRHAHAADWATSSWWRPWWPSWPWPCWRWSSASSAAAPGRSWAAARSRRCRARGWPTTRPAMPPGSWSPRATPA